MKVSVEKLDGQMAKLTIEVEPEVFDQAIDKAYKKQRSRIQIPGFRKGKAPRQLIEKMYGPEIFYDEAANQVIDSEYPKAYDECGEEIVSTPKIEITQIGKGEAFIFTAEVALRPEGTLGKYKGVTVVRQDVTVTDEELEEEVKRTLQRSARTIDVTDRSVVKDDTVNIDYEGKVDGVPFDGGKDSGHNLKIGSGTFIPGFEEQIINHNIGDEFDVNVTFPEQYHAEDLAGKDAVFTVKINSIKAEDLPELNDEFVSDTTDFETVKEFKDDLKTKLTERKESMAMSAKQEEALEKIVADSKMEIPEAMIDTQVESMIRNYTGGMAGRGISMEQYFQMTGMTPDMLREQMRPDAERQIKVSLCLEEIAKAEGIECTDEDVDARIAEMGAMYGIGAESLKEGMTEDDITRIKKELAVEKAANFVGENVKERAKPKKKSDKEEGKEEE